MKRKWLCLSLVVSGVLTCGNSASAALVGQWLLEEGTGTTAADTSGLGRDGTLAGTTTPAWVPGLYAGSNWALDFSGSDGQKVQLPDQTGFIQNAPGATLMAWVRFDADAAPGSDLNILAFSRSGQSNRAGAYLKVDAEGFWKVDARQAVENASSLTATSGPALNGAEIYFVAGVVDYVGAGLDIYVGDSLGNFSHVATTDTVVWTPGPSQDFPNQTAAIGSNPGGDNATFNGVIDGARVYNEALDSATIQAIYNAELVPEPSSGLLLATFAAVGAAMVRRRRRS